MNWDKTITLTSTHKLIDSFFKNWKGMTESDDRQIKRSINIDIPASHFYEDVKIRKFGSSRVFSPISKINYL